MRAAPSVLARPAWYDRNGVSKAGKYSGSLSPHSETSRISYTCPAGKKAMVESLIADIERLTAATTPMESYCVWVITPSGGSGTSLIYANLLPQHNAAKDRRYYVLGTQFMLYPGDKIELFTMDGSTGGTVYYFGSYKLTEFDA